MSKITKKPIYSTHPIDVQVYVINVDHFAGTPKI
jgi:hypothetical protein